jgi:cytochrome c556
MERHMIGLKVALPVVLIVLLNLPAFAERKDIDLRGYDDELMRDLDKTIKYFEPDIVAGNVEGAKADAEVLEEGFRYTEDFFSKKENAEDAVEISQRGLQAIAAALTAMSSSDLDRATTAAREAAGTCRSCHDIYKPLKQR